MKFDGFVGRDLDGEVVGILREAGEMGLRIQQEEDLGADLKRDSGNLANDIVTRADFEIQSFVLNRLLNTKLRDCMVYAEEDTPEVDMFSGKLPLLVTLDPVNGTKRFFEKSRAWEICLTVFSKDRIFYSVVYVPGLNYLLRMDENHGVREEGELPKSSQNLVPSKTVKIRKEYIPIIGENDILKKDLEGFDSILDHPFVEEIGGSLGTNLSFVAGHYGTMLFECKVEDSLVIPHYAKLTNKRLITYGREGEFGGEMDYFKMKTKGGQKYFSGGYVGFVGNE